ncbi:MAG: mechanosensitive ion channel family protein [Acidobacteriota bacterium]
MQILEQTYLGNSLLQWGAALAAAAVALVVLGILKSLAVHRLKRWAERTETEIDDLVVDLLSSTKFIILLALALYVGSTLLLLPESIDTFLNSAAAVVFLVQAAIWGNRLITFGLSVYMKQRIVEDAGTLTMVSSLGFICRLVFYSLIVMVGLGTLGFDVTALVTGLGIGGIAVALAVQNILSDLFGSLSIVLDKPFVIGDFITVGDYRGTVEHIGLKSTRIRSNTGEQLVIANADLLGSRLRNFKRMKERRGALSLGVTYDTPLEKLEAIPSMIEELIRAHPMARFDRAHFSKFGDFSLNFEAVYWVTSAAYGDFMDTQQAINLQIFKRFAEEGIEFAFPTQTLYLQKSAGEPLRNAG